MSYRSVAEAESNKESTAVLKTRRCPDCGGCVLILKAEAHRPYRLFWRCMDCKGEAGIMDEALEEA